MDSVLGDIDIADPTADEDTEMADIAPRAIQKQEKQKKDKKKDKDDRSEKKKKRNHGDTNGEVDDKKRKKS